MPLPALPGIILSLALATASWATPPAAPADDAKQTTAKTSSTPRHRFKLTFEPTAIEGMGPVRDRLESEGLIAGLLDALSDEIRLPVDVPVTFRDCEDENAFWDPESKSMTYCYEMMALHSKGYDQIEDEASAFMSGVSAADIQTGTTAFILLHETAHGLIDLFNLPITGREEDVADQFATLLMISGDDGDEPIEERPSRLALMGAYFFRELADDPSELTREIFSDAHALGQQRYYDVMCLVLGSDPATYGPILTPGMAMVNEVVERSPDAFTEEKTTDWLEKTDALNILPQERAIGCEDEYRKYDASWTFMLDRFMR